MPSAPTPDLGQRLAALLGAERVTVDRDIMASVEDDWTGRFHGSALALVRPVDAEEVAALVGWCAENDVALTTRGGNTGLVGGAVPDATVVVSTEKLTGIESFDGEGGQVSVGAGVPLAELQRFLKSTPWEFGVDLGARDSATLGGMVATNAGGLRVLRHGAMRAQLLGIEAVLGDGSIVRHMSGLLKDNTGYDLAALLCGSEGTLAIVTEARLRLVPAYAERVTALIALPSVADAVVLCGRLRREVPTLDAVEAVIAPLATMTADAFGLSPLFGDAAVVVLAEAAGHDDPSEQLAAALEPFEHIVATDGPARARLWRSRETATETIGRFGIPHKLDVTLPSVSIAAFVDEVQALAARLGARVFLFGHLGDGNLHVNVLGPASDDESVDDAVLNLVASYSGSVSAEHGIGRAKRRWLSLCRSPAEIAAFRAVKHALDPAGILNPGVLLPDVS